jgi:hypothetical protein
MTHLMSHFGLHQLHISCVRFGLPATILLYLFTHPAIGRLFGAGEGDDDSMMLSLVDEDEHDPYARP